MRLGSEKYVSVTTFRRSGTGVATATWITDLGAGRVGFWTSSAAGKAKRIRHNPQVTIQPSDNRGKAQPDTEAASGTAELVTSGPDFDAIQSQIKAKYGVMVPITRFLNAVGHLGKGKHPYGDTGVVITLSDEQVTPHSES